MSFSTRIKEIFPTTLRRSGSCWAIALLATIAAPAGADAASNWTLRQLPPTSGETWGPPLSGVSCPTDSLCVAVGGLDTLAFSQAPTGGAAKWHMVNPAYPVGPGKTCVEGEPHCPTPARPPAGRLLRLAEHLRRGQLRRLRLRLDRTDRRRRRLVADGRK